MVLQAILEYLSANPLLVLFFVLFVFKQYLMPQAPFPSDPKWKVKSVATAAQFAEELASSDLVLVGGFPQYCTIAKLSVLSQIFMLHGAPLVGVLRQFSGR